MIGPSGKALAVAYPVSVVGSCSPCDDMDSASPSQQSSAGIRHQAWTSCSWSTAGAIVIQVITILPTNNLSPLVTGLEQADRKAVLRHWVS